MTGPAVTRAPLPAPGFGLTELGGHSYSRDAGPDGSEARGPFQQAVSHLTGGGRVINYGRGSAKTHEPDIGFGSFAENCVRPRLAGPDLPYCGLGVLAYGINDLTTVPDASLFRNYLRLCAALLRSSRVFATSAMTHSHGSTATPAAGLWGSVGNPYAGGPIRSITTAGATSKHTLPADYTGRGWWVLFHAGSGDAFSGTITVKRDGVSHDAISPDEQADGTFSVNGAAICGPSMNGAYLKRITAAAGIGALAAGDEITITYSSITGTARVSGCGIDAQIPPSVVICNVARIPVQGSAAYTESDARVAIWNAVLPGLCAEFADGLVRIADIDTPLAKAHFSDGRHPDDYGQALMARAILDALPPRTLLDQAVLARGVQPDIVAGLPLGSNLTGGGGSTNSPWCRPTRSGTVIVGGALTTTGAIAAGDTLATLPAGCRPYYSEYFTVSSRDNPGTLVKVRVDGTVGVSTGVSAPGRIQAVNPIASGVTFDLGGITFQAER